MRNKITKIVIPRIFYYNFFKDFCKKKKIELISYNNNHIFYQKKIFDKFNQKLLKKIFFPLKLISDLFIFLNLYKKTIQENEYIIVEGIYPGIYLYIFNLIYNKKIKIIYYNSDWLVDKNHKILGKILNNFFWKKINYFLVKKSIFSLSSNTNVIKKYFKEYDNLEKKVFYISTPFNKNKNVFKKNSSIKIIFLGIIRNTEIFINFINQIQIYNKTNKKQIIINIYGIPNIYSEKLKQYSKEKNFYFVRFHGYFDYKKIDNIIKEHDYGLHLNTSTGYSNYAIPSKVYLYIGNQIPIITNKNLTINKVFKNFEFGVQIDENKKEFKKKLNLLKQKQNYFKKNINKFHQFSINNFYETYNKITRIL
jgi:hypothetical protein